LIKTKINVLKEFEDENAGPASKNKINIEDYAPIEKEEEV
jgi:hypothetical protein